jgi:hypothetical protein
MGFQFCRSCRPFHRDTIMGIIYGSAAPPSTLDADAASSPPPSPSDLELSADTNDEKSSSHLSSPVANKSPGLAPGSAQRRQRIVPLETINGTFAPGDRRPPLFKERSVEDGVLHSTLSTSLLPLGLKIRRFFDGYGFFDASIIQIKRADSNLSTYGPVSGVEVPSNFSDVTVRLGGEGGCKARGSMMTYKTRGRSTIMRVAGSATSAMRKPQTVKRVRNDEA